MPVTLLFGDNALEIGEALAAVRASFHEVDVITFDGPSTPLPAIAAACRTAGLFAEERLVVVHGLHERATGRGKKAAADMDALTEIVTQVAPGISLLLVSPGMAAEHPLVYAVRSMGGTIKSLSAPRKADLSRWISDRARRQGVPIEDQAAHLLAELIGPNPVMLGTELDKLATYAGGGQRVTPFMVDLLVGAVTQETVFALVDAIAAGNKAEAFRLLREQIDGAASTPIEVALYLIRMLARQARILLGIRLGQEAGKRQNALVAELKLPRYYADRYFRQAQRLSRQRLQAAFEQLAAFEYGLKSGKADPLAGLDLLVASLCA